MSAQVVFAGNVNQAKNGGKFPPEITKKIKIKKPVNSVISGRVVSVDSQSSVTIEVETFKKSNNQNNKTKSHKNSYIKNIKNYNVTIGGHTSIIGNKSIVVGDVVVVLGKFNDVTIDADRITILPNNKNNNK